VQIDRRLAIIERDMAVLSEHLPPVSDDEFRQAMQRHREDYCTFAIQAFASITLWVGALVTVLWQLVH
jgi:hypothetical protein